MALPSDARLAFCGLSGPVRRPDNVTKQARGKARGKVNEGGVARGRVYAKRGRGLGHKPVVDID